MNPVKLPLDVLTPFSYKEHHRYPHYINQIHCIEEEIQLIESEKRIDATTIQKVEALILRRSFLIGCMHGYEKDRKFHKSGVNDYLQALVLQIVSTLLVGCYLALNPSLTKVHADRFVKISIGSIMIIGLCLFKSHYKLTKKIEAIEDRFNERTTPVLLEKIEKACKQNIL